MAAEANRARLILSVLRFLQDELKADDVTPDKTESLEVASQCLRLAYEVEDIGTSDEPSLLEIYAKAVPSQEIPPVSEEDRQKAEDFKKQGNESMKSEAFENAIEKYTQAIGLNPLSAVYYCNRAAAYTGLGQHESALNDCRKAIRIDKSYSKAYSRMGLTYSKMERYEAAVECYEKALKLDPDNEGYKNNMKIASDKVKASATSAAGGFPGFGGMGGLSDMLNNPMMMNMAQQVMSNPAMQQMAMNMMGSFMGGAPPPGGADGNVDTEGGQSTPNMGDMLRLGQQFAAQVSQENPELVESLRGEMNKPQSTEKKDDNQ